MVLMNGESAFDLDKVNNYRPDSKKIYCKFDPATHKPETVPENNFGTFVKTVDNAIIYFSDIAFKMLIDFSIKASLENTKYLVNEAKRANKIDDKNEFILKRPSLKRPLGSFLAQRKIRNVLLPDDSKIVPSNLKILSEYDMISMLCSKLKFYDKEYADACLDMIEYLSDYIYLGRGVKSLVNLHSALVELFCTMSIDEFIDFTDGFYVRLDKIPVTKYSSEVLIAKSDKNAVKINRIIEEKPDDIIEKPVIDEVKIDITKDIEDVMGDLDKNIEQDIDAEKQARHLETMFTHQLSKVSGSDITGLDETYSINYCEAYYNVELERADSTGFLDKIIMSRTTNSASPIDLLAEKVTKEHQLEKAVKAEHQNNTQIDGLKNKMTELRERASVVLSAEGRPIGIREEIKKDNEVKQQEDIKPEEKPEENKLPDGEGVVLEPDETELDNTIPDESEPDEAEPDDIIPDESEPDDIIPDESEPDAGVPDDDT